MMGGGQALSSGQTAHQAAMAGNQTHSWAGVQWALVAYASLASSQVHAWDWT